MVIYYLKYNQFLNIKLYMSLNSYISEYTDSISSNNIIKPTTKPIKPTKISNSQFTTIIKANEKYKKQIYRSTKEIVYETFENKNDFDQYIENDIDDIKKMNWKTMPICTKISIIKQYISNDNTITYAQKKEYSLKIDKNKELLNQVKYDKASSSIVSINYSAFN